MQTGYSAAIFSFLTASLCVSAADSLKAFPEAEEGMVRHVLHLPQQADEFAFQVELLVGKTVQLDGVNQYFFSGTIEAVDIEGWGFTRYVVSKLGPMAGTRIGVHPDAPKADRFITLGGGPHLIRYNSRLPVVVYVPEGVEVRYRIWHTTPESTPMDKG